MKQPSSQKILHQRLFNQGLSGPGFKNAREAVEHPGAVQAQDFNAAKWSLGLRIPHATAAGIEAEYNQGEILRTHVMRPTWHLVLPQDIRWMQKLTAPQVKAKLAPYNRKLELSDALLSKSTAAIASALQGQVYLTRGELKAVLARIGIQTNVQRLAHIISWAELDGLICSGPLQDKQLTYALLEERTPKIKMPDREESLARLAWKYFNSHGPAQLEDFTWWSGLAVKDAQAGLDAVKGKLIQAKLANKIYWFANHAPNRAKLPAALLLSLYDEYIIAYRDRSDLSANRDIERMFAMGNALTAVIILNGQVAGAWSRAVKKAEVEIRLKPFRHLTIGEQRGLKSQAKRYGKFFKVQAVLAK